MSSDERSSESSGSGRRPPYGPGILETLKFLPREIPTRSIPLHLKGDLTAIESTAPKASGVDMGRVPPVISGKGTLQSTVREHIHEALSDPSAPVSLKGSGGREGFTVEASSAGRKVFDTLPGEHFSSHYGEGHSADYRGRRLPQHMALMSRVMQQFVAEKLSTKRKRYRPVEIQFGLDMSGRSGRILASANQEKTRRALADFYHDGQGINWINETYEALREKHATTGLAEGSREFKRMHDLYKVRNFLQLNKLRQRVNTGESREDIARTNQFMHSVLGGNVRLLSPTSGATIHAEQVIGKRITSKDRDIGDYFIGGSKIRCLGCATHVGQAHKTLVGETFHPTSGTLYPSSTPSFPKLGEMAGSAKSEGVSHMQAHLTFRKRSHSVRIKRPTVD